MAKYTVELDVPPTCYHEGCMEPVKFIYIDDDKGVMCFSCESVIHRNEVAAAMEFPLQEKHVTVDQLQELLKDG